jgi:Fic family protein
LFRSPEFEHSKSLNINELAKISFPLPQNLLPGKDHYQVAEMRNHLIASKFITDTAFTKIGTAGPTLEEIHALSKILLIDTQSVALYKQAWNGRIALGDFRNLPIGVRSNPLRIFPYHLEVPAIMRRFIEWRDRTHASKVLHPIIFATHIFVAFVSIHPFADGNGRVGRSLLADYLIRQRLLPTVLRDLDRTGYVKMVSDASDHQPEELCQSIVNTQLDTLFTMSLNETDEEN